MAKADVLYCYYQCWIDNCKDSIVYLKKCETPENAAKTAKKIAEYEQNIKDYTLLLTEELTWNDYCARVRKELGN